MTNERVNDGLDIQRNVEVHVASGIEWESIVVTRLVRDEARTPVLDPPFVFIASIAARSGTKSCRCYQPHEPEIGMKLNTRCRTQQ